jgi:hypothetical protein
MQKTTEIFLEERLDRYDEWLDAGHLFLIQGGPGFAVPGSGNLGAAQRTGDADIANSGLYRPDRL